MKCLSRWSLIATCVAMTATTGNAQTFSVAEPTTEIGGTTPLSFENIFLPPANPAAPFLVAGDGVNHFGIDVDAFSYGRTIPRGSPSALGFRPQIDFSVDSCSIGNGTSAVSTEFLTGLVETDVFRSNNLNGSNAKLHDGMIDFGLDDNAQVSTTPCLRGVDGYDRKSIASALPQRIYFSVRHDVSNNRHGGTIMVAGANDGFAFVATQYLNVRQLGLIELLPASELERPDDLQSDEIDALEIVDRGRKGVADSGDIVLFSLAPRSPTLVQNMMSPADIFAVRFGPAGTIVWTNVYTAAEIGLDKKDNVTALSVSNMPIIVTPLPLP